MDKSLSEPLIYKSNIESKPETLKTFEKKIVKYEDLIQSEIERVKNSYNYNVLKGHSEVVTSVALSQDGKLLISGSDDKTIKVWNLEDRREEFTLQGHTSEVTSVAISQNGKYLASGSEDKTIKV